MSEGIAIHFELPHTKDIFALSRAIMSIARQVANDSDLLIEAVRGNCLSIKHGEGIYDTPLNVGSNSPDLSINEKINFIIRRIDDLSRIQFKLQER